MVDSLLVFETALAIRPHLPELLGAEAGEQMRQQLDQLLQQVEAGESVEDQIWDQIWDLLTNPRKTRIWVTNYQQTNQKSFHSLPGQISMIAAPQFKCPLCNYTWSRQRQGIPTPYCPQHRLPLELVP